jgi:hypothetical protein
MRRNPQRVAWTVLWVAFVTFCVLAVGIPLGIRHYLLNATEEQDTQLQVIAGTVLVEKDQGGNPIGVTESMELTPGDKAVTDASSRATLDLFERSHVILYSNTNLELERVETPRFAVSGQPNRIILNLTGGLIRAGVALPGERDTLFRIVTPHTSVRLEEGSYRIEVTNEGTQVTTVRGRALVGRHILPQGMRTTVDLNGGLPIPLPAAQNLVENGNFEQAMNSDWLTDTVVLAASVAPPVVEMVEDGSRPAVRFLRREQDDGNHTEVSITQKMDKNVRDFDQLRVSLDVKLDFQSLPGGGQLSSEFPIIVRLDYKDLWGSDKFWLHGFYYQNQAGYPIASDWWGQPRGEQIPQGVWYPYESDNLMELLGENKPAQITGITVYASGWNYDSQVSEIQVVVE